MALARRDSLMKESSLNYVKNLFKLLYDSAHKTCIRDSGSGYSNNFTHEAHSFRLLSLPVYGMFLGLLFAFDDTSD